MSTKAAATPTERWDQLVAGAVLGSDRAVVPPMPSPALADLLAAESEVGKAEQILTTAGVLSTYVRIGSRPAVAQARVLPSPPSETRRECSLAAAGLLTRILHEAPRLLAEWGAAADQRSRRAPEEQLPALLDWLATTKESIDRALWRRVLGVRGVWLAQLNPAWQDVSNAGDADRDWRDGAPALRVAALRGIRADNAEAARTKLAASWPQESPEDRARFLEAFVVGLSGADEEFLETALMDKSRPVRLVAADLLARLPDSAYCRRMAARSVLWLQIKANGWGRTSTKFQVESPTELDAALKRDAMEVRTAKGGIGPRAQLLAQALAATPLTHWELAWGVDAKTITTAAWRSEWRDPLFLGWGQAAIRQANADWAMALARQMTTMNAGAEAAEGFAALMEPVLCEIVAMLPMEAREVWIAEVLGQGNASHASKLVRQCLHHWSDEFSSAVLRWLRRRLAAPDAAYLADVRDLARGHLPYHMSPALADEVDQGWPRQSENWSPSLDDTVATLVSILRLRQAVLREFTDE